MSIGLSRSARFLLSQIVEVYHRGEQEGLSGDQLAFTLSVRADRTTALFVAGNPPIQTDDPNAILVPRANDLIEEFVSLASASNVRQYVVTQAGLIAGRSISPLPGDAPTIATGSAASDPAGSHAGDLAIQREEKSYG